MHAMCTKTLSDVPFLTVYVENLTPYFLNTLCKRISSFTANGYFPQKLNNGKVCFYSLNYLSLSTYFQERIPASIVLRCSKKKDTLFSVSFFFRFLRRGPGDSLFKTAVPAALIFPWMGSCGQILPLRPHPHSSPSACGRRR